MPTFSSSCYLPPSPEFPALPPYSYVERNAQLLGTFCPSASEQLEYQSPNVCIHTCVFLCVCPLYACQDIISLQLLLLSVHSRSLCLHMSEWATVEGASPYASAMVRAGVLIGPLIEAICFFWRDPYIAKCIFQSMQPPRRIFSVTCCCAHVTLCNHASVWSHINSGAQCISLLWWTWGIKCIKS